MLHAILNGKIRGLFDNIKNGMPWRKAYSTYEDFLTASVIGRMTYLPEDIFWKLIKVSSLHSVLPENVGSIKQIEFWPNWPVPPWLSDTSQYRQPDVLINFNAIDIIVEAKKNDSYTQNQLQWVEQIQSYVFKRDTEGEERKPIVYWVLGGMGDFVSQKIIDRELYNLTGIIHKRYPHEKIEIAVSPWINILSCLINFQKYLHEEVNRVSPIISSNERQNILRITNDIIEALRLHGIKEWHFLSEVITFWSGENISKKSIMHFEKNAWYNVTKKSNHSLRWCELPKLKNNFDNAINWYGGQ